MKNNIEITDNEFKPFLKRTSTLVGIVILILFGIIVWLTIVITNKTRENLERENATALIIESKCVVNWKVEKWTAKRKYNKSQVPASAWDIDEDTWEVCDEYAQECVRRDSTGTCISYEDSSTCIRSHTEVDYDYNIMDWVEFQKFKQILYDGSVKRDRRLFHFNDLQKYKITNSKRYTLKVNSHNKEKEFNVKEDKYMKFNKGDYILIERRKKSKKILNLIK